MQLYVNRYVGDIDFVFFVLFFQQFHVMAVVLLAVLLFYPSRWKRIRVQSAQHLTLLKASTEGRTIGNCQQMPQTSRTLEQTRQYSKLQCDVQSLVVLPVKWWHVFVIKELCLCHTCDHSRKHSISVCEFIHQWTCALTHIMCFHIQKRQHVKLTLFHGL